MLCIQTKFNAEQLGKIITNMFCILRTILLSFLCIFTIQAFNIWVFKDIYTFVVWTVMNYISKFLIHSG